MAVDIAAEEIEVDLLLRREIDCLADDYFIQDVEFKVADHGTECEVRDRENFVALTCCPLHYQGKIAREELTQRAAVIAAKMGLQFYNICEGFWRRIGRPDMAEMMADKGLHVTAIRKLLKLGLLASKDKPEAVEITDELKIKIDQLAQENLSIAVQTNILVDSTNCAQENRGAYLRYECCQAHQALNQRTNGLHERARDIASSLGFTTRGVSGNFWKAVGRPELA